MPCIIISIHALLAESDRPAQIQPTANLVFLSTLSLRRATLSNNSRRFLHLHFYPRSPCGERQFRLQVLQVDCHISIHALLAESDSDLYCAENMGYIFLSTLSLRRATRYPGTWATQHKISIHALLAESDSVSRYLSTRRIIFLSTLSLRRATLSLPETPTRVVLFLSTLSLRRATGF